MIITYDPTIPRDFLPIVRPRFEEVAYLFPNWCQTLSITYSTENPNDFVLTCKSEYAYRLIQVCVFEPFFSEEDWKSNLIHEIQHAIVAPFTTEAWHLASMLKYEPEVIEYISKQLVQAEESMAQDMTDFVNKIMKKSLTDS